LRAGRVPDIDVFSATDLWYRMFMKRLEISVLVLLIASVAQARGAARASMPVADVRPGVRAPAPCVVLAQVPAGEEAEQVPVVEGVEKPDSPTADEAAGNSEARLPGVRHGSGGVEQPQVEVPDAPQQPKPQQD